MQLPSLSLITRASVALALAGLLAVSGWAQQSQPSSVPQAPSASKTTAPANAFVVGEYSKPHSHFPNPIAPYTSRTLPPPSLANTPRIQDLLHDGKLMLSMNDAVALALENNMDIAIQRYNLSIADTDILRTKSGATFLGVNTGIVQNTPGGTTGGFATSAGTGPGGTSAGAAGAAAGLGGIVSSTLGLGAPTTSFDPIVTGTLQMDRNYTQSSSIFSPIPIANTNTGVANFAYNQGFHWGTNMSIGFSNTHTTTDSPTSTYTPFVNSGFNIRLTQHLLQGFGFASNTRFIRIAKNNREISDVVFRFQVITTVDQIENMYWDLVNAYENLKVQQDALALAQKTLSDNKKQVEIGTLAPIEVVRAQSQVATSQQSLTVAQTNLELQQLLMKNALSRTLEDPALIDAEVIPTDTTLIPAQEEIRPTQDLIVDALGGRPEVAEARMNLSNTAISNKAIRNSLLPSVDLFAYYGGSGIGGNVNPGLPTCQPGQNPFANGCFDPNLAAPPFRSSNQVSYGNALSQLVDSTSPDKGIGVAINIPLRNRQAQALQIRSELEYRQAQMRLQQIENQIRIEVRNAQFALQQNRAAVDAAKAAVALAEQSLDAEQKKYALGASTTTLVLQQQSALTQAKSNLVSALTTYEKARVELDRATSQLLQKNGIDLADAQSGVVNKMPSAPYVQPRATAPADEAPSKLPTPQTPMQQQPPAQPDSNQQPPQS
jgi:outer membrane protein TolC